VVGLDFRVLAGWVDVGVGVGGAKGVVCCVVLILLLRVDMSKSSGSLSYLAFRTNQTLLSWFVGCLVASSGTAESLKNRMTFHAKVHLVEKLCPRHLRILVLQALTQGRLVQQQFESP
jgi:hypothetical protein